MIQNAPTKERNASLLFVHTFHAKPNLINIGSMIVKNASDPEKKILKASLAAK